MIATTDDSSPPPVTEGSTFHHIKNFAGTEQMMNNGEVAAQGAGADFQNGEVQAPTFPPFNTSPSSCVLVYLVFISLLHHSSLESQDSVS